MFVSLEGYFNVTNERFAKICNFLVNFLIKFSLLVTNISYIL